MSIGQNNVRIIVTDDVLDMYSHLLLYSWYCIGTAEARLRFVHHVVIFLRAKSPEG
jgi:hypothetical protein